MRHKPNGTVHVLHVVPGIGRGGMELAMARVITGLTGPGMRHSIVAMKRAGGGDITDCLPEQTRVYQLDSRPNEPQLPARLGRLIRRIRPTVVHARNWGAWPDTAMGRLLARPATPFVFSFHGLGSAGYAPLRRRLASRVLVRMTTQLMTLSEASKRMLVTQWGWPDGQVEIIPNGVDTERFSPAEASPAGGRIVVGTVGNLRPVKNQAMLIRACAELARGGVDLELRIAGGGDQREALLALARSEGLDDRLSLVGHVGDVPGFLRQLDVFVLSSNSEQHPNALNEAMACGVASIATRVGCVEELLDGGACGRIISAGDVAALVAALSELAGDRELRLRLGALGRGRVCERYSMDRMLAGYRDMYERLSARMRR